MKRGAAALAPLAPLALFALFAAGPALAHDQPYSFLDLRLAGDSVSGRVVAHVEDLNRAIGGADAAPLLDSAAAEGRRGALIAALGARLDLRLDGRRLALAFEPGIEVIRDRKLLAFRFRAAAPAPMRVAIAGPLFADDPQHETYVNVYEGDRLAHQDLLDASRRRFEVMTSARPRVAEVVRTFVLQGIHHIFIGPDHILFVVGLLLLGGGVARLLKIVTAFTLAHSLTLALATLHLVNPPSRVIEPAIALSIVAIGVENLLAARRGHDWRAPLAFGFGFLHGFGFASVLAEFGLPRAALGWSLFSFNLGVEIGQACIVLAVTPALAWLAARSPGAHGRVAAWGSALVIAAGTYWFVQRVVAA